MIMGTQKEIRRETTVKETTIETITEENLTDNQQDKVQRLLDECQGFHYSQSSKFSSLARSLVLGVIGTIWVISYTHNGFVLATNWLLASLISSFVTSPLLIAVANSENVFVPGSESSMETNISIIIIIGKII